jgi:hypothetical protein
MAPELLAKLWHFAENVVSTSAVLVGFVVLRALLRRAGVRVFPEFFEFLNNVLDDRLSPKGDSPAPVNLEYRDAAGVLMTTGPFVSVILRNGRGGPYELRDGIFPACDPTCIRAGATVDVSIQEGLIREHLQVQIDHPNKVLFIRSGFTLEQLVHRINGPVLQTIESQTEGA